MVAKEKKTGKETKHSYTYNAYGDVATLDDTSFVYEDASGQVTKETTKLTKNKDVVKNYAYDSAGNKSAFAVKAGDDTKLSLQYQYDGESRLTGVTDEKGNQAVGYAYDTDGNLAERTVSGSGLTTTYTYDYQNRLTEMKNQTGSTGVISEYRPEYLLNGQKSKEDSDITGKDGKKSKKTAAYTYDLLGRITKETKTGSEDISYTYDNSNNRKEVKKGDKVTAYKYNKNDELLRTDTLNTSTEEDSVVIYKYDKNGNQLATVNRYEIPSDQKSSTYIDIDMTLGDNRLNENVVNHYNALNQLTQTLTRNYKVSFAYDAEGLRTSKTVNGEKTVFVWDGDQLVLELTESGKVRKRYIRGNDLVYADKGTDTEKQYYVTDPHGNVVQLTDESGKVTKAYEYDSFGNEVKPDSKDDNPFRYCGEYYDQETGEIYLRARYYQPTVGRFLTRDSYTGEEDEPESLHLYTYCGNDGVNAWDPSGHWGIAIHTSLTRVIAKAVGFGNEEAKIIAAGCQFGDHRAKKKEWKNGIYVKLEGYNKKIKIKREMFKMAGGEKGIVLTQDRYKINIQEPSNKLYNKMKSKSKLVIPKGSSRWKLLKQLFISGIWLHGLQDRWAHGTKKQREKLGHPSLTDDFRHDRDWATNEFNKVDLSFQRELESDEAKKKLKKNKRLWNTINVTKKYITEMRASLEGRDITSFEVNKKDLVYVDIIYQFAKVKKFK